MASRMRLLPRSMKLEKSSRTSDLLWRMSARSSCRWLPLLLPMRTPMSPWWARRSSTVRLSPVCWGSRQRIRKIVSAVQQFVDKLNSMDWISKRRSCSWYYIGLDWDREKWRGSVASKFIRGGEKNAVKYADEIIYRKSMMRRTFWRLLLTCPKSCCIYSKSWKLQFSASSSIIIIEDYYLQTFLHSLSGFPSCWSPSVYSR